MLSGNAKETMELDVYNRGSVRKKGLGLCVISTISHPTSALLSKEVSSVHDLKLQTRKGFSHLNIIPQNSLLRLHQFLDLSLSYVQIILEPIPSL